MKEYQNNHRLKLLKQSPDADLMSDNGIMYWDDSCIKHTRGQGSKHDYREVNNQQCQQ